MPHGDKPPQYLRRLTSPVFTPLGGPSVYPAWRGLYLRRLTRPVFIPLGRPSIYAAWRGQRLSRLAGSVFTPLGEVSTRHLARPMFTPLGEANVYAAWRTQYLRRLADPVFIPLDEASVYPAYGHLSQQRVDLPDVAAESRVIRGIVRRDIAVADEVVDDDHGGIEFEIRRVAYEAGNFFQRQADEGVNFAIAVFRTEVSGQMQVV